MAHFHHRLITWGEPSRPAIVLIHGFMGDPEEWQPLAAALRHDYFCLAPALPGHDGHPPPPGGYAALVDALWQQLGPLLPKQAVWLGYSLGGRLLLEIARRHPQRIAALLLESAHPGLADYDERDQRRRADAAWADRFESSAWPQLLDDWYRQPVFASLSSAQRAALIARRAHHNPHHLAAVLRAGSLADQPDQRPTLRALAAPIYFITGEYDAKFLALGRELAAEIPALTLAKLDALGHNCHAEAPKAVAAIVQRIRIGEHLNQ